MKVVDVNEFYAERGGGVRTYVNAKLEAARALGHELVVIAPGPEDRAEERLGGRVVWVKGPPMPLDPRYYVLYREKAVHELLALERPDVVEGSSPWTAGWFAARYRGPGLKSLIYHQDPVAVYPHTFLDRWVRPRTLDAACAPYWAMLRKLAAHYDTTVVAGQWLARRLAEFGIVNPRAVPFGIEHERFSPALRSAATRAFWLEKCGLGNDARLLVTISRLHPEKRVFTLLAAVKRLNRRAPTGLVVFGDGPTRSWVEKAAARTPGVHLAGFVQDRAMIAEALSSADAFVHGSAAETFGFVIAEALASGCPVVAPARGGAVELVDDTCSETYEPGDPHACAAAVERLLSREPTSLRRNAARVAREKVCNKAEHFERLFALYGELLNR